MSGLRWCRMCAIAVIALLVCTGCKSVFNFTYVKGRVEGVTPLEISKAEGIVIALADEYNLKYDERDSHGLERFGVLKHTVFSGVKFKLDFAVFPGARGIEIMAVWAGPYETDEMRKVSEKIRGRMSAVFPGRVTYKIVVQ